MRTKNSLILISVIFTLFLSVCTDSSTGPQSKIDLITRSWRGEEYFLIYTDSTFRVKDLVETLEFKSDGSYFFYKPTMSSMGVIGQWKLEGNGNQLRLTRDTEHSEVLPITHLSSASFVIGDTNSRGFKLVPK